MPFDRLGNMIGMRDPKDDEEEKSISENLTDYFSGGKFGGQQEPPKPDMSSLQQVAMGNQDKMQKLADGGDEQKSKLFGLDKLKAAYNSVNSPEMTAFAQKHADDISNPDLLNSIASAGMTSPINKIGKGVQSAEEVAAREAARVKSPGRLARLKEASEAAAKKEKEYVDYMKSLWGEDVVNNMSTREKQNLFEQIEKGGGVPKVSE